MRAGSAMRAYRRILLALAISSLCGLAHASEDTPDRERPALPSTAAGLPAPTRRPDASGGRGGSATAVPRPDAARESGPSRPRRIVARWLRRVQATAPDRTPAGRAAAPESGPPPAIVQPSTPGAPEVTGIRLPRPRRGPEEAAAEVVLQPPPAVPTAPTPLLLNRALQLQDSPFRTFGWIQNSFTGNANGVPRDRQNFGVFPNHLADQWMGNQYYLALENPLDAIDIVNFGFRFDMLFGNDWLFTKDYGLFDRAFPNNHFAGLDLPQVYAEAHLPILTPRGLDIRAGRFFSLTGFESPMAIARPQLSVPYAMNFTPFTYFGAIASLHLHERLNVFGGTVDGFDRWPNRPYKWGFIGAMAWTSRDQKLNLILGGTDAYDQLPRFPPANAPFVPVGVPAPGFLPGRLNPFYNQSRRAYMVGVLTYKWTDKLTQALEVDSVFDPKILGYGGDPYVPHAAAYYGFVNWFLYQFNEKVTGMWRSEVFWDPYGLATGVADTFHEITVGLNIRPEPWLWVRPEARYDWAQFTHPYNNGTRNSQLTLGFDVIFLF
jgi:hypothetical protein